MRNLMVLMLAAIVVAVVGCSGEDPVQVMKWADQYFPMEENDRWYYTVYDEDGDSIEYYTRQVGRIRNYSYVGIVCTPIYDEIGLVEQCWTKDAAGLHIHLFLYNKIPRPTLLIPFDLRSDQPYEYDSFAGEVSDPATGIRIKGAMTIEGYVTRTVPAGTFEKCLKLRYDEVGDYPGTYWEYYAPGVGLLDDGTIVLDSAVVGGVRYP